VGSPHARVGNCQASNKEPLSDAEGFLLLGYQTTASAALFPPFSLYITRNPAPAARYPFHPLARYSIPMKHFHLMLACSTFTPFLVIVGCLDV
ncbi:hypothetical protein, partial [Cronobacter dublinensis]|uniref:hypothetical protein n=1 Tax=Cronobacter dublinensis TaxID=413497 RepID=UPI001ED91979